MSSDPNGNVPKSALPASWKRSLLAALVAMAVAGSVLMLGRGTGAPPMSATAPLSLTAISSTTAPASTTAGGLGASTNRQRGASQPTRHLDVESVPVTDPPTTTSAAPKSLALVEWSPDGLASLPFGTQESQAIDAMSGELGAAPDDFKSASDIGRATGAICTRASRVRWGAADLNLEFDESGRLASVAVPPALGSTVAGSPTNTLGDLRSAFGQVSVEYFPPEEPSDGAEGSYRWTVQGADANASGFVAGDSDEAPLKSISLQSERFEGVECYE